MERFLRNIGFFVFPLLALVFVFETMLRKIPNDYSLKNDYLEENSSEIEVLILGSSHSYYGLNPEKMNGEVFNASYVSQSLKYDYKIFDKFIANLNNLMVVVVPIDYSTLFANLSVSKERWRLKNYSIYYGFNEGYSVSENFESFSLKVDLNVKRIYDFYDQNTSSISCSFRGYGNAIRRQKDLIESGIVAAKRHTKPDRSYLKENVLFLEEIARISNENSVRVLFYSSPCYQSYIDNLEEEQLKIMTNTIESFCNSHSNCSYYDLMQLRGFLPKDFADADHLNSSGADKLSYYIDSLIGEN